LAGLEAPDSGTVGHTCPGLRIGYLLHLEEYGHNAGGRHAAFRTIRAFILWYKDEVEPEVGIIPCIKEKLPKCPQSRWALCPLKRYYA
jgi:hypothetical protein